MNLRKIARKRFGLAASRPGAANVRRKLGVGTVQAARPVVSSGMRPGAIIPLWKRRGLL